MAKLTIPADRGTHNHNQAGANKFEWLNTEPVVAKATHWRLKIGKRKFGYNYYLGTKVPFDQLYDDRVKLDLQNLPCYATVEWSKDRGTTWRNGLNWTTFDCL